MKLLFALLLISTTALCQTQKVDTLKFPVETLKLIESNEKEIQEPTPAKRRFDALNKQNEDIVKSGMDWNKIPYSKFKGFIPGVGIIYIKDEKK